MAGRRNPDKTREDLLQAGFEEIHKSGFRSADVQRILSCAGVTKGALYHHFGSKKGLGFAVVDEVVREMVLDLWVRPLNEADNPIDAMIEILTASVADAEAHIECGCPLNNLAQEMSPVDEEFRERVGNLYTMWRRGLARNLVRGQRQGTVREDVEPEGVAAFLIATCEGSIGVAKGSQNPRMLELSVQGIVHYLETLRPAEAGADEAGGQSIGATPALPGDP